MDTILFFGLPGQGRTNPTLPLVTELVHRKEPVRLGAALMERIVRWTS